MGTRAPSREATAAVAFAKLYIALCEALRHEGVPEDRVREEARLAATSVLMCERSAAVVRYDPAVGPCPTCERG